MRKIIMLILVAAVFAFIPLAASAATIEGSVQGYICVTQGITCPVGMEDPMAAAEQVFVVLTKDNKYYFVPNVDRAVLARHINARIRVTGTMIANYDAIRADKIEAYREGTWRETYSKKSVDEILKMIGVPGT